MEKVLIQFSHGLGDAVQLTIVLQHLRKYRPDWELYLSAMRGKHSIGYGYCKQVWHDQEPGPDLSQFNQVFKLDWWECYSVYSDSPSTKASNCLRQVFCIHPDPELFHYRLHVSDEAKRIAADYLASIGATGKAVAIHYGGNTSPEKKNLTNEQASAACEAAIEAGYVPLILDWDRRSPLPDDKRIFCPMVHEGDMWGGFGTGDAERLAALMSLCSLCVGIDSGPQKCMMASGSPTIGVWTRHSPVQFADLSDALHLVPANWQETSPCRNPTAAKYFQDNYKFRTYENLERELHDAVLEQLGKKTDKLHGFTVTKKWQDWVIIKDIYLQDAYRTTLIPVRTDAEVVVDIGAHIGTFARLWHERNPAARIACVEVCPENAAALRKNVGDYATIFEGACTYEPESFVLSAVGPNGRSTGGTRIVQRAEFESEKDTQYERLPDQAPRLTLHEIMDAMHVDHIDILKLDCEGSEYSILEHAPIERIGFIVGEYHGFAKWEAFRRRRFAGWDYGHMSRAGEVGNFHLRNPQSAGIAEKEGSDVGFYQRRILT